VTDAQGEVHGVEVHDARGVVVANYGQVFQYYGQASQPLKSVIGSEQFRALVDNRLKTFVGREFVFEEIDRILGGAEGDSGYIVIKGEPGIGKTAVAAALAIRGYVHHFNIAAENIRTAKQFLEDVCAQLILRYRLPYDTLPQQAGDDSGFLSRLLSEAADAAREHGELPVVIVVDALDEANRTGYRAGVNRLYLPRTLPAGVFMILTTRDEDDIQLVADKQTEIWIRDNDARNMKDVADYVRGFVAGHPGDLEPLLATAGLDVDKFVQGITKASEGNFMYLVYVLPDLARGRLSLDPSHEIAGLPEGLEGYYLQHWRAMKASDETLFTSRQRPVLCFLAISLEPVTVMQLVEWTHLEPGDVRQVISSWREFLNSDDGTPEHYRLYHRSFAEFLDKQEDLRWYHDKLASAALARIPGFHP
jgi:AAA ATPase domain